MKHGSKWQFLKMVSRKCALKLVCLQFILACYVEERSHVDFWSVRIQVCKNYYLSLCTILLSILKCQSTYYELDAGITHLSRWPLLSEYQVHCCIVSPSPIFNQQRKFASTGIWAHAVSVNPPHTRVTYQRTVHCATEAEYGCWRLHFCSSTVTLSPSHMGCWTCPWINMLIWHSCSFVLDQCAGECNTFKQHITRHMRWNNSWWLCPGICSSPTEFNSCRDLQSYILLHGKFGLFIKQLNNWK